MNLLQKIRWRLEKYVTDPMVRHYLRFRLFEREQTKNFAFITEPRLKKIPASKEFQDFVCAGEMNCLYEERFDAAYSRGVKNDPYNCEAKEYLRYRVYIDTIFAELARAGGGGALLYSWS
ncbi:MAG: hypothetical protein LBJ03_03890 [Holosporales bacterium]|jgi:hypothetical protein|nr:hypothetical protein [Holosporales bacterium]